MLNKPLLPKIECNIQLNGSIHKGVVPSKLEGLKQELKTDEDDSVLFNESNNIDSCNQDDLTESTDSPAETMTPSNSVGDNGSPGEPPVFRRSKRHSVTRRNYSLVHLIRSRFNCKARRNSRNTNARKSSDVPPLGSAAKNGGRSKKRNETNLKVHQVPQEGATQADYGKRLKLNPQCQINGKTGGVNSSVLNVHRLISERGLPPSHGSRGPELPPVTCRPNPYVYPWEMAELAHKPALRKRAFLVSKDQLETDEEERNSFPLAVEPRLYGYRIDRNGQRQCLLSWEDHREF